MCCTDHNPPTHDAKLAFLAILRSKLQLPGPSCTPKLEVLLAGADGAVVEHAYAKFVLDTVSRFVVPQRVQP